MSFQVFSGGRSPFDDAHKKSRRFVILRDDGDGYMDVAFCTSKKRPEDGAWLSPDSPAFAGTGFSAGTTIDGRGICRVRKDSVWVRGARRVGLLNPAKDRRFAAQMVRTLCGAQIAVFAAKEAPLICMPGRAPARDLEYQVVRFTM